MDRIDWPNLPLGSFFSGSLKFLMKGKFANDGFLMGTIGGPKQADAELFPPNDRLSSGVVGKR